MMEDRIEVEVLRARDLKLYGSPDGPSFAYLVSKYERAGYSGDRLFQRILAAAQSLNPDVNS